MFEKIDRDMIDVSWNGVWMRDLSVHCTSG